jgi:hypothetical protein
MTISDVMTKAESFALYYVSHNGGEVARKREELRAAILALLDAEAQACAAEIEGEWWRRGPECAESIRARIAARKGGAKP